MSTFALDKNYQQFNFEEVSVDDLMVISGGSGALQCTLGIVAGAGLGALTGAAAGSAVPGLGTGLGALAGGIFGGMGGAAASCFG